MQKKILNSVLSQVLYIMVSSVIGLALVPITIDMLGKVEYGAFELILSLIVIDAFLEFGLGSTLVKYIPEYKTDISRVKIFFWSYYYIKFFLTLLGFIIIMLIGYNFDLLFNLEGIKDVKSIKISVYIFGIGLIINSAVSFLDNFLRGYVYFGIANITKSTALLLFFIIYYLYYIRNISEDYSIIYIALIWFILRPILLLLINIGVLKYLKLNYILKPVKFNFASVESTLQYMYGMTYIVMIAQLLNKMPKIILGILMSPVYVAYWGIMEKVKEPFYQLNSSMLRPFIPILSDKGNMVNMSEQKIIQAARLQYFFISFLGTLLITHSDLLIQIWLGEEFSLVSQIVKVGTITFLFPGAGIFLMMYYAEGKTKINMVFTTIHTIVSLLVGTLVLLTTKNIVLFAFSFSIVSIVIAQVSIFTYLKYFKLNKLNFLRKTISRPFTIMIVYYVIINYFTPLFSLNLFGLICSILISLLLYICLFFIFMKKEDKVIVLRIIKRKTEI